MMDKLESPCGCRIEILCSEKRPKTACRWMQSVSIVELGKELGTSPASWFETLSNIHVDKKSRVSSPALWSPCPAGGVLNISVSTPCSSLKIQNDSPVHMDTPLMLRSSSCESIPVQKGWSVKTEAFDDSMENGCENQLLTFTLDSSNLSWSSSMATPRDMAFKKFPVDAERQKGPARALFSPTSCGGDSELDDASLDLTVEQEEQSISLYLGPTSEATVLVNSQNMIEDNTNPHCLESRLSRKRGHPKFLFMDEESERKTSIDDFLADVFSSPDTEARQRRSPPNSCKKQRLSIQLHSKQSAHGNRLKQESSVKKIAEDTHRGKVLEEDFSEKSIERRHLAETNIPEVQTDVHMGTKHVASEGKKVSDIDKEIENTDSVMEMCKHSANFVEKVSDIDKETKHTAHLVEKVSGGDNETKHKTIAAEVAQHRIHPKTKDAADCTSVVIHGSIAREQQTATGTDVSACGKQVDLGTNRKNRDEESRSSQAGEMLESASGSLERIALSGKPLVVSGNVLIQEGDPDWAEFEDEMNWSNSEDCLTDDGEHAVVDLSRSEIEEDERLMCGIGSETKDERLVCNISSKADKRWTSGGATVIVEMQLNFEADALSVTGPPCAGITPELVMETNMDDTDMDNINTVEDVHMEGAAIDSMIDVKDVDTSNSVVGPLLHDTESSFKKNLASEEGKDDLSFALECLDEREFFPQIMKEVNTSDDRLGQGVATDKEASSLILASRTAVVDLAAMKSLSADGESGAACPTQTSPSSEAEVTTINTPKGTVDVAPAAIGEMQQADMKVMAEPHMFQENTNAGNKLGKTLGNFYDDAAVVPVESKALGMRELGQEWSQTSLNNSDTGAEMGSAELDFDAGQSDAKLHETKCVSDVQMEDSCLMDDKEEDTELGLMEHDVTNVNVAENQSLASQVELMDRVFVESPGRPEEDCEPVLPCLEDVSDKIRQLHQSTSKKSSMVLVNNLNNLEKRVSASGDGNSVNSESNHQPSNDQEGSENSDASPADYLSDLSWSNFTGESHNSQLEDQDNQKREMSGPEKHMHTQANLKSLIDATKLLTAADNEASLGSDDLTNLTDVWTPVNPAKGFHVDGGKKGTVSKKVFQGDSAESEGGDEKMGADLHVVVTTEVQSLSEAGCLSNLHHEEGLSGLGDETVGRCKDAKDSPDNSGTMKRASSSQKPNFQPPFKKAKFVPPSTTKKNQTLDLSHEKHCYEISRDQPSLQNDKMSSNIHLREEEFSTSSLTFATPDSLEEARLHQEKIIRHKKRQKVKPVKGKWLTLKQMQKQIKLRDLYLNPKGLSSHELLASDSKNVCLQLIHAGVSSTVLGVSSHTAEEYRFFLPAFYPNASTGILVGDNALLVCDAFGYAGKEEFYRAFLTVDGVDPNLISQAWVYNHYRWVVWKTAAYEVALPRVFASRALTPDIVMMQLKYRYDREVDACHRSALKKIVERDDTACKRLVLCISDIRLQKEDETVMMEVTDGWYRIWAKPDPALQQLIDRKKIKIGRKIITTGAELAGSHDSCSPLEIPTGLYLKLWGNSTRPAPYWSRLGYQPCPASLCVPLSSVVADGGLVGCIDVVVVRKYPIMFMEKQADGSCVFRNAEMEDRARRCYEQQKEGAMERLCAKLQVEMEREDATAKAKRKRHSLGSREIKALTTGAELCEVLDGESHPEELQAMLTATQRDQVWEHRQRQQEERQAQFKYRLERAWNESTTQGERIVSPVQKLLVAGCCRHDVDKKTSALLTVWRPGSDWEVVSEGQRYCIFSLTASSRTRQSRHGIQLTAGRQVRLQNKPVDENLLGLVYEPREVWSVSDLQQRKPLYNEIDFTGRVSDIVSTKPGSDRIHAVDSNGQLITVWFWGGLQAFGLQNFFKKGLAFSGFNLYVRNSGQDRVEVTAFPETSYFTVTSRFTDHYSDKHRKLSSGEHPDNSEDTATSVGQFSESPETKQRKAVQKQKLFRLQSYGKPPPLTPLPNCMSPAAAKGFKPVKMRNDKMLP
ncbi:hypothetical protein C0Q70_17360 [Pomacea canaliculata]|uniref:Tower domain-containing protein n=1 Tax=Pomacea canaliculata TaxID=400727 RepID=A0A2T7NK66_POMCA|nr:hypothetical protein C0Q70_17360 [Pomacea canaliculata]